MTNIIQTPVPIGPIPVDVIRVPEDGVTGFLFLIAVLLAFVWIELRVISDRE